MDKRWKGDGKCQRTWRERINYFLFEINVCFGFPALDPNKRILGPLVLAHSRDELPGRRQKTIGMFLNDGKGAGGGAGGWSVSVIYFC